MLKPVWYLVAFSLPAATLAQTSAQQVLEQSATALGGLDKLQAVTAVRTVAEGLEYFNLDDRTPPAIAETITTLRRMTPVGLRQTLVASFAQRDQSFTQTIIATDSVVSQGGVAAGSAFDAQTVAELLALAPDRIVLTALAARDLRVLPDSVMDGARHHVVAFRWADARVQLAIDTKTGFPDAVRLIRAYPANVFWSLWGDVTIDTHWSGWTLERNGVWYPREQLATFNGIPWRRFVVTTVDVAPAAPADSFTVADSVRAQFAAVAHTTTAPQRPVDPVTLADGVVLFKGFYQSTLVREPDGIIILDASQSNARSQAVLAESARLFPGVPISAVVTTASAWMQIGGVREYASRGIPIYALDVNVPQVRALLAAPYVTHPDSLARAPRAASLRVVRAPVTLGSGPNELRLLPTGSGDLMVYWPARRWLYASDRILPPMFEPNYNAARAATLQRTITDLGIAVDSVFAFHLPLAAWPAR